MSEHLSVVELFSSIQGEGYWSGEKMIFLRFAGCNLRCHYCDSAYASRPEENLLDPRSREIRTFTEEEVLDLAAEVGKLAKSTGTERVCLTGGEPTVQPEFLMMKLVAELKTRGLKTHLELNGTNLPDWIVVVVKDWIAVSPKLVDPDACFRHYGWASEIKFVLEPNQEIPRFTGSLPEHKFIMPMTKQPFEVHLNFNTTSYKWAAEKVIESKDRWRLSGRLQEFACIR